MSKDQENQPGPADPEVQATNQALLLLLEDISQGNPKPLHEYGSLAAASLGQRSLDDLPDPQALARQVFLQTFRPISSDLIGSISDEAFQAMTPEEQHHFLTLVHNVNERTRQAARIEIAEMPVMQEIIRTHNHWLERIQKTVASGPRRPTEKQAEMMALSKMGIPSQEQFNALLELRPSLRTQFNSIVMMLVQEELPNTHHQRIDDLTGSDFTLLKKKFQGWVLDLIAAHDPAILSGTVGLRRTPQREAGISPFELYDIHTGQPIAPENFFPFSSELVDTRLFKTMHQNDPDFPASDNTILHERLQTYILFHVLGTLEDLITAIEDMRAGHTVDLNPHMTFYQDPVAALYPLPSTFSAPQYMDAVERHLIYNPSLLAAFADVCLQTRREELLTVHPSIRLAFEINNMNDLPTLRREPGTLPPHPIDKADRSLGQYIMEKLENRRDPPFVVEGPSQSTRDITTLEQWPQFREYQPDTHQADIVPQPEPSTNSVKVRNTKPMRTTRETIGTERQCVLYPYTPTGYDLLDAQVMTQDGTPLTIFEDYTLLQTEDSNHYAIVLTVSGETKVASHGTPGGRGGALQYEFTMTAPQELREQDNQGLTLLPAEVNRLRTAVQYLYTIGETGTAEGLTSLVTAYSSLKTKWHF